MHEVLAVAALAAALAAAVVRSRRVPEALVALVCAALLVAAGAVTPHAAWQETRALAPTLALLAALLALGDGCERAGLFDALAVRMAGASGGRPRRLLALVFAAAAAITAVLGLDATVVLLTPAAFAAAARARLPARPHVYACTHLANSASLLLPVSNLTNLLAFRSAGLSFTRFAALMALPWAAAIAIEWAGIRRTFALELSEDGRGEAVPQSQLPRLPIAVLIGTLAGFLACSRLGIDPAWPAAAGALVLQARHPRAIPVAIDLPLLAFVLGLGVIVRALTDGGLGGAVTDLLPGGAGLLALLGTTLLAAVLANVLSNVPALLVLLPAAAAAGPATVLAALIGVNAGPNLTYTGSLATLLWRRVLRARGAEPPLGEFLRLGALTVPPVLVACTVALWLAVAAIG
ncbi:MAG: arsenical pump rane protein [Solirubrobacteraceae bacterium]|nr:arsenical pump rane protein [Solirubrobacteraceae bacterium]